MAVRTPIEQTEGLYFIKFMCCEWFPLFEITNGYDAVYKCPTDRLSGRSLII
ncbi:MAG: hypothetical protein KGM16_00880 [Bacteroidota bacterium]|nr:hypothetical protein [Bacteroidota bacterium]